MWQIIKLLVVVVVQRNPDFREITLDVDGKCVLRFAIANGFRNIQNLMQKMKRGKISYHFVEVMACPSGKWVFPLPPTHSTPLILSIFLLFVVGCVNGGAQLRPLEMGRPMREITGEMERLYRQLPQSNPDNPLSERSYSFFFDGKHNHKTKTLLHTNYHPVEKMKTVLNIKW